MKDPLQIVRLLFLIAVGTWLIASTYYYVQSGVNPLMVAFNAYVTLVIVCLLVYTLRIPQGAPPCSTSTSPRPSATKGRGFSPWIKLRTPHPTKPAPTPISPLSESPLTYHPSRPTKRPSSLSSPDACSPHAPRTTSSEPTTSGPDTSPTSGELVTGSPLPEIIAPTGPTPDSLVSMEAGLSIYDELDEQVRRTYEATRNRLNKEHTP